ncbi:MAG: RNA polymerase sigma factor [Candidatus Aminicenantia bacterium]
MKVKNKDFKIDELLAEKIKNGDFNAVEELMDKYKDNLFNFIYRMISNYQTAEDIFQETWTRVIEKIGKFNPKYSFKIWLFTISRNLCLDSLRKTKRRRLKQKFFWAEKSEVLNESKAGDEKLMRTLNKISPKLREVIILRFYHQCDLKEISDILRIPVGTVKSRLNRGINSMKKIWFKESRNEA